MIADYCLKARHNAYKLDADAHGDTQAST